MRNVQELLLLGSQITRRERNRAAAAKTTRACMSCPIVFVIGILAAATLRATVNVRRVSACSIPLSVGKSHAAVWGGIARRMHIPRGDSGNRTQRSYPCFHAFFVSVKVFLCKQHVSTAVNSTLCQQPLTAFGGVFGALFAPYGLRKYCWTLLNEMSDWATETNQGAQLLAGA
jgi:hypothetical protein